MTTTLTWAEATALTANSKGLTTQVSADGATVLVEGYTLARDEDGTVSVSDYVDVLRTNLLRGEFEDLESALRWIVSIVSGDWGL